MLVAAFLVATQSAEATSVGVDSGLSVAETHALWQTVGAQLPPRDASWLRVREISLAFRPVEGRWVIDADKRAKLRERLTALRREKLRIIAFVELEQVAWPSGARRTGWHALPRDLRDVHALARALRANFDDVVDVWEVGNEPEIFYPETAAEYCAVLKAFYLGYHTEPWTAARVLMAPLGKPAGRYLEALVRNGLFAFTDAFNVHLYGFAEDIRPFFDAQVRAAAAMAREVEGSNGERRSLPVFVTELGYGGMFKEEAENLDSRERQARWFRRVEQDFERSGPEARLAFVLKPYVSPLAREMGMVMRGGLVSPALREWWTSESPRMREIKLQFMDQFRRVPVVMDVAVQGRATFDRTGWQLDQPIRATLFVYNFSMHHVTATVTLPGTQATWHGTDRIEIPPGGRVEIPFVATLVRTAAELSVVARGEWGESVWSASLRRTAGFPAAGRLLALEFGAAENEAARGRMLERPRAFEEPEMRSHGRWLATPGVEVEETSDHWRVTVRTMPPDARWRRATAELVLPAPVTAAKLGGVRWECRTVGGGQTEVEVQWRTPGGTLFGTPFVVIGGERRAMERPWETFEQVFFARAAKRWRLEDNPLASVVLAFRPLSPLPVTIEIAKLSARVR